MKGKKLQIPHSSAFTQHPSEAKHLKGARNTKTKDTRNLVCAFCPKTIVHLTHYFFLFFFQQKCIKYHQKCQPCDKPWVSGYGIKQIKMQRQQIFFSVSMPHAIIFILERYSLLNLSLTGCPVFYPMTLPRPPW